MGRPLVGVLVSPQSIANLRKQILRQEFLWMWQESKKAQLSLFFFAKEDVEEKEEAVWGVHFEKIWRYARFPFPQGVFAKVSMSGNLKERMESSQTICLNARPFNKWEVFLLLNQDPKLSHHLPKTLYYSSFDQVCTALMEHSTLYLKACVGRMGKQVLRLRQLAPYIFEASTHREEPKTVILRGERRLEEEIKRFFRGKPLIIQEGIEVLRKKASPLDFRVEVQHVRGGGIKVLAILIRQGYPHSPITIHHASTRLEDFMREGGKYFREKGKDLGSRIERLSKRIYRVVEKHLGQYGEIGMDFAVDRDFRIWFLECNSQSTKVSLRRACSSKVLYEGVKNQMGYMQFLAYKKE